jgi:hypothetical protein
MALSWGLRPTRMTRHMRIARCIGLLDLALVALLSFGVSPAAARPGCSAPSGTAATDQYCETIPTAAGTMDATAPGSTPLAAVLPKSAARRLRRAGVAGQAILAMPAATMTGGPPAAQERSREAAHDPRLDALSPGSGLRLSAIADATSEATGYVDKGFAWTMVLTLLGIAGVSAWGTLRGWSER